jgi:hypothetical protein
MDSGEDTANMLADFFVSKIQNIRDCIPVKTTLVEDDQKDEGTINQREFCEFDLITHERLKAAISGMKNKTCSLDPVPTNIVKECLSTLSPILIEMLNFSFSTARFPESLKKAIVTPIVKDPNKDASDPKNVRPISNLPFLAKLHEKLAFDQLSTHIEENQLHARNQSAYRRHYSCETAMLKIIGDVQLFLHDKHHVAIISLDSSAAFDTIDHVLLLNRLEKKFNITNKALNWIKSYLENRTFSVKINESESTTRKVQYGVPQGSLLGPLFYALYTSDIESLIKNHHGMNVQMYADDVQLYIGFLDNNKSCTEDVLMKCLTDIQNWMNDSFIKLNVQKTQFIVISPRYANMLTRSPQLNILFNEEPILTSNSLKILGIHLTTGFDFKMFINKKVSVCSFHLRNLRNISKSLPTSAKIILVVNLILTTLDYCNVILVGTTDKDIKPLQKTMNSAVRFIFNLRRREHITPFLFKLHFLPIRQRINFKTCVMAFKIKRKLSPDYLMDLFDDFVPTTSTQLRVGMGRDQTMFARWDKSYNDNLIFCKLVTTWNNLPYNLRKIETITEFKTKLKTHYFEIAFPDQIK